VLAIGVDLLRAFGTVRLTRTVFTINEPAGGGEATSDLAPASPSDL
jgi:hypothetical protein